MSILARIKAWLGLPAPSRPAIEPDTFALRDWADLPTHHPRCG